VSPPRKKTKRLVIPDVSTIEVIESLGIVTIRASCAHLCPFKDEVDYGTVTVTTKVPYRGVEIHSWVAYLESWDDTKISHEFLTAEIGKALVQVLNATVDEVLVVSEWTTAGADITVRWGSLTL
jgi:NADPH-dependent 7-cyano-7-deazaguanine reductase QueF